MDARQEMMRKRAVIKHIVKNKLTREEAEQYARDQGVTIRLMSFPRAVSSEEWEAGQRFVGREEVEEVEEGRV